MARINLSQEAVDYQVNPELFIQMTSCLREYRKNHTGLDDGSLEKSGLAELVNKKMNSNFIFKIHEMEGANAWVGTPPTDISQNSILNSKWKEWSNRLNNSKGAALIRKDPKLLGSVDRKNGKLGGLYSTLPFEIYFSSGLMANKHYTDEEIAAIALHEIGHVFSYFETLHHVVYTNLAIADALEEAVGAKDPLYKVELINDLKRDGVVSKETDAQKLVKLDKEQAYTVLVSDSLKEYMSRNECPFYNLTVAEQQADAFAVRMGAGKHSASGLVKLYRQEAVSWPVIILNLFATYKFIIAGMLFVTPNIVLILCGIFLTALSVSIGRGAMRSQYDSTKDRVKRIRNDMIAAVKKGEFKGKYLKKLLDDIDNVTKSMEEMPSNSLIDKWIVEKVYNFFTGNITRKEREQDIESLINNELFVIGNKFKFMGN